ncbi:MAG: extracellular solute-binding protein [Clostridiales bacterium]|nr:extracellular solute-binding protein [Clostridiales bacterium]
MKRCSRCIIMAGIIGLILISLPVQAEKSRVVIAVTNSGDAMHPVIEEAFYKANPESEIIYSLYPQDQLKTMILAGKADFDLCIQPIEQINVYGKDGYLEDLYPLMGLAQWPENLLDIRREIELNGSLYGMPIAVYQTAWSWKDALAQAAGIAKPAVPWNWGDYKALSNQLPTDINMDGTMDVYLMYGAKTQDNALSNVQLGNLYDYFSAYPGDFTSDRFLKQLDIFTGIVVAPSLLSQDTATPPLFNESTAVLISNLGAISPLSLMAGEYGEQSFLPPPIFEADNVFYLGGASACAMMRTAPHREAAKAFLAAMLSPEAMSTAYREKEMVDLVYKQMPGSLWSDMYGVFQPSFEEGSGNIYVVPRGRTFQVEDFPYTKEQFDTAQNFRNKLKVPSSSVGRPFYDAVVNRLVQWKNGALTLDAAIKSIQEVYLMIVGE